MRAQRLRVESDGARLEAEVLERGSHHVLADRLSPEHGRRGDELDQQPLDRRLLARDRRQDLLRANSVLT